MFNEQTLEQYLAAYESQEQVRQRLGDLRVTNIYLTSIAEAGESIQYIPAAPLKYRPAPRPPPRSSPRDFTSAEFGYLNNQAADELLERLGIEKSIQGWIEQMRLVSLLQSSAHLLQWMVEFLLHPLLARMQRMENAGMNLRDPPPPMV